MVGPTGWAERGKERAELAGTAAWGWWLKAEETGGGGGGGGVRVGFLAWHRGIDTPVGAQRHQRLRRPTSLHLDDRTNLSSPSSTFFFPPSGQTFTPRVGYEESRATSPSSSPSPEFSSLEYSLRSRCCCLVDRTRLG